MCGYLIAEDMGAVMVVMGADESDFQHWTRHRQQQQLQQTLVAVPPPPTSAAAAASQPTVQQQQKQQKQGCGQLPGSSRPGNARMGTFQSQNGESSPANLRHSSSLSLDMRQTRKKRPGKLSVVMHVREATCESLGDCSFASQGSGPSAAEQGEWLFQPTAEECDVAASALNGGAAGAAAGSAAGSAAGAGADAGRAFEPFQGQSGVSATTGAAAAAAVAAIAGTTGSSHMDRAGVCFSVAV